MANPPCPHCERPTPPPSEVSDVVTRDLILDWMRASGDSAADFYEAVATYFGIESEELEAP
jgi:hypothetical protein